jgi:hypothetical protein
MVHYHVHKSLPLGPNVSEINPVHAPSWSYLLKIRSNIIFSSAHRCSKWSLFLKFIHQNVFTSLLPHTRYMHRPSHSSWFDHSNRILRGVQIMQLLNMLFPPISAHLAHRRPKVFCNLVRTERKLHNKRTKGLYVSTYILLNCIP